MCWRSGQDGGSEMELPAAPESRGNQDVGELRGNLAVGSGSAYPVSWRVWSDPPLRGWPESNLSRCVPASV